MSEREFGPYTLVRQIAVGGMAEIYLAKTKGIAGFEKFVALKMIHPNYSQDDHFIQMLIDEAKMTVLLQHVNIAQTFDLGRDGDIYYITMEFVDGADVYQTLRTAAEADKQFPIDVAAYIAKEVASGLDYAHRKQGIDGRPLGIVHRDISPQNVLLSHSGEVKVADFGIAKNEVRARQTAAGVIKGKYYYMSPEQAWGERVDLRSDVFSTGIVLYEMLVGQMLYLEEDLHRLLARVRAADIESPKKLRPEIPIQLERIVMRALAKKPEDRYQSANQLATDLQRFLHAYSPVFRADKLASLLRDVFGDKIQPISGSLSSVVTGGSSAFQTMSGQSDSPFAQDPGEFSDENSVIFNLDELRGSATASTADLSSSVVRGDDRGLGEPTGVIVPQSGFPGAATGAGEGAAELSKLERDRDDEECTRVLGAAQDDDPFGDGDEATIVSAAAFHPSSREHEETTRPSMRTKEVDQSLAARAALALRSENESTQQISTAEAFAPTLQAQDRVPIMGADGGEERTVVENVEDLSDDAVAEPSHPGTDDASSVQTLAMDASSLPSFAPPLPAPTPLHSAPQTPSDRAETETTRAAKRSANRKEPSSRAPQSAGGMFAQPSAASERLSPPPGGGHLPVPNSAAWDAPFADSPQSLNTMQQMVRVESEAVPDAFRIPGKSKKLGRWVIGLVLFACCVVGGVGIGVFAMGRKTPTPRKTMEVVSIPAGAKVFFDGKLLPQVAPLKIKNLSVGTKYVVGFQLEGYKQRDIETDLEEGGETVKIIARLELISVSLTVNSTPPGADVVLDGTTVGRTPIVLPELTVSQASEVELRLSGYRPVHKKLDWSNRTSMTIEEKLQK